MTTVTNTASASFVVAGVRHTVHFQRESVRCGKPSCRCHFGIEHGPYWYAYTSSDGRIVKAYVGRELDETKGIARIRDRL